MPLFTKDNAAAYGKAGALARWTKPEPLPPPPLIPESMTDQIKAIELSRVRSRLDTLDRLMSEAETDRQWDNLSRAYERVFRAWVHLAGIPGPGQRKPAPERIRPTKGSSPLVEE